MNYLAMATIYVMITIQYILEYELLFAKRIRIRKIVGIGVITSLATTFLQENNSANEEILVVYATVFILMFYLIEGKFFNKLYELILLFCVDESIVLFIEHIFLKKLVLENHTFFSMCKEKILYALIHCALILIFLQIKKRLYIKHAKNIENFFGKYIYIFNCIMIVIMQFAIFFMNHILKKVELRELKSAAEIVIVFSIISLFFVVMIVIYIKSINEKLKRKIDEIEEYRFMQEVHYENLLKRETNTKRYRHDMKNHIFCLRGLIEKGNYAALKDYVGNMCDVMEDMNTSIYDTGNDIMDILTNYYLSIVNKDIRISINNRLDEAINMDYMCLCTIYGNILQNAVEEVMRYDDSDKYIEISFTQGKFFTQISVKNSCNYKSDNGEWYHTQKEDKDNHGIGLINVKTALDAVGGKIDFIREKEYFECKITIKNIR